MFTLVFASCYMFISISGHGFLYHPGNVIDQNVPGAVRNINAIDNNIDSLRNPTSDSSICRNASPGTVTPINLSNGVDYTITLAFSIGAQHIGPCSVQILDADDLNALPIEIASANGCAVMPISQFNTDKASTATNQCPGKLPVNLVTNDMCLSTWTFKPINVDSIKCKKCVMRWTWDAQHISSSNPEKYENCADVIINGSQSETVPKSASSTLPAKVPIPAKIPIPANAPTSKARDPVKGCDCDPNSGMTYFKCSTENHGYCVCYSKDYNMIQAMACADGTVCKSVNDKEIGCVAKSLGVIM